jgi:hypothetical protein
MNTRSILLASILAVAPLYSNQAISAVPSVDGRGIAAYTTCPRTAATVTAPSIHHFDKIVFVITGKLVAAPNPVNPNDTTIQERLDKLPRGIELDIKVNDNPKMVANLKSKVVSFLGADILNPDIILSNMACIDIKRVEYTAVVCPKAP